MGITEKKTEENRTEQNRTEQNRTEQNRRVLGGRGKINVRIVK